MKKNLCQVCIYMTIVTKQWVKEHVNSIKSVISLTALLLTVIRTSTSFLIKGIHNSEKHAIPSYSMFLEQNHANISALSLNN